VSYENLVPGRTYTLKGILMDKETGRPVTVGGESVSAETTFTPTESSGSAEVVFTFDSTELEGKALVVFEYLIYEDAIIAEHTDIDDEAQTVTVEKEMPEDPPPTAMPTPGAPPAPVSPQTGRDGLPYWLLIVASILFIAAIIATAYTIKRRKPY